MATDSSFSINFKRSPLTVDLSTPLGTLSSPRVYLGSWANRTIAVKLLSSGASLDILAERIEIWESLDHANVLQTFGFTRDPDHLCLGFQYHANGNIRQYIMRNPVINRAALLHQAAVGMEYLHSKGMVHGSLKPSNILIKDDGTACIADADLAKVQPSSSANSHRYYSPEAWKGVTSQPSDVFAFAMTAYEIFSSEMPWGVLPEKQIYQFVVIEDLRPDRLDPNTELKSGLNDRLWGIIEEAWARDPRLRPSFRILLGMWPNGQPLQESASPAQIVPSTRPRQGTMHSFDSGPPSYEAAIVPPSPGGSLSHETPNPWPQEQPNPCPQTQTSTLTTSVIPEDSSEASSSPCSTGKTSSASWLSNSPVVSRAGSSRTTIDAVRTIEPISEVPNTRSCEGEFNVNASRRATYTGRAGVRQLPEPPMTAPLPSTTATRLGDRPISSVPSMRAPSLRSRWETGSFLSMGASSAAESTDAVLLVQALQIEVKSYRKADLIDDLLIKMQHMAFNCEKSAQKLITAGAIPTLIDVLKMRAHSKEGLVPILLALGLLAQDSISANTIFRTNTTTTLIRILEVVEMPEVMALTTWCLNRVCRTPEIASGLVRQGIVRLLQRTVRADDPLVAQYAAWTIGALVHTDAAADELALMGVIPEVVGYLQLRSSDPAAMPEDISAAAFAIGRISRSIKLAKQISKAGALPLLAHHIKTSTDPGVLHWVSRAIGCLMRPNSGDMAKALLEVGTAAGLARVPSVLPTEDVEPLGSFAFCIQRFSCAEWGGGTRKALMEAGAVDALLAALRTAATEPYPRVHIELALAVSFLGDVGGSALRKEVVNAGGIDILKTVASNGAPDVAKACNMAVTSITGNIWTRNAASAKTAMSHNWSGGCPDHQPPCPSPLGELAEPEEMA